MNRSQALLKDTAFIALGDIFSKGIFFLLIPIQTAVMSKGEYGLAEMLFNLINILIPIFTLGIAEAGMRFSIGNIGNRSKVFSIITTIPIIGGFVLSAILYISHFVYPRYAEYASGLLLLYLPYSLMKIYLQFSKGIEKLRIFLQGSILFSISLVGFTYYFLYFRHDGVNGYLNTYTFSSLLTILYLFLAGKFYKNLLAPQKAFEGVLFKQMITYSLPLICNLIAWWITNMSNRYILAYFTTLEDVGIYSVLAKFSLIIVTVYGMFFQSWQISAAKNIDMNGREKFFAQVHDYYLFAVFGGSFIFITMADFWAGIFINKNFIEAFKYLPGIVLSGTISCLPMYWGAIYAAFKDTRGGFYSTFCGSIASVILNFILIPTCGIYGAIFSTILCYLIVEIYRVLDINKSLNIDLHIRKHLLGLLIYIVQVCLYTFSQGIWILVGDLFLLLCFCFVYKQELGKMLLLAVELGKKFKMYTSKP